jgi:hypothetical protein
MNPGCFSWIVGAVLILACGWVFADVVEEETWYDASGTVVKTVKRTYTGADAVRGADWEPSWVAREREQARKLRGGSTRYRSSSPSRYGYSWGSSWFPISYSHARSYACRVPYRRGFHFSYRGGHWSAGYGSRSGCGFIAY